MGYIKHDAIIVTTSDLEAAAAAQTQARLNGMQPTPIIESRVNSYYTFLVPPDGSKEGWTDSDLGDDARGLLIEWLRDHAEHSYSWAEVCYGDENGEARVTDSSDRDPGQPITVDADPDRVELDSSWGDDRVTATPFQVVGSVTYALDWEGSPGFPGRFPPPPLRQIEAGQRGTPDGAGS